MIIGIRKNLEINKEEEEREKEGLLVKKSEIRERLVKDNKSVCE